MASVVCAEPVATAAVAARSSMQTAIGRDAAVSGALVGGCPTQCLAGSLRSEEDDVDDDLLFAVKLTNVRVQRLHQL
jgi:uncharacterized metal-binding protein